jgi:phosphopantothenoylcysteine decarboxylase / phosphopantothenate---cysteine ligase
MSGRVLLCVSGGIAAYKAPELVRALVKRGHEVQVLMTPAADAFVTPLALATVSRRPVRRSLLDVAEEGSVGHIELADWPDLVLVAPATADLLARAAAGIADDLVSTVLLATVAPVVWAPAMNTNMWRHPATRHNLGLLASRGARFVGPDVGELACGWVGEGKMIDPETIVEAVDRVLQPRGPATTSWSGRRVLVSAGPTRAYLDPVRFLTNASTGAMGFAVAEAAAARGAEVTLVSGPVERPTPAGCRRISVSTAPQMFEAMDEVLRGAPHDLVAMVAAVADLAPARSMDAKLTKGELVEALAAGAFVPGIDVLAELVRTHRTRAWFLGFGAQTVEAGDPGEIERALVEAGVRKMRDKGCDAIFVNRVGVPGHGFESDTNTGVLVFSGEGGPEVHAAGSPRPKADLAAWLMDQIRAHLDAREAHERSS